LYGPRREHARGRRSRFRRALGLRALLGGGESDSARERQRRGQCDHLLHIQVPPIEPATGRGRRREHGYDARSLPHRSTRGPPQVALSAANAPGAATKRWYSSVPLGCHTAWLESPRPDWQGCRMERAASMSRPVLPHPPLVEELAAWKAW